MKWHGWLSGLAVVVLVSACGREQSPAASPPPPPEARSAAEQSAALDGVGRSLAQAIADPALRSLLHQELSRSPLKEGKLHLQTFLAGPGAPLREAMALATSRSPGALSQVLSQLGSMELYLPVAEHRQRWAGGDELIIATQWDEQKPPTGVDLKGTPVPLSLEAPPELPVLVVVPAEAFDANGVPYEDPEQQTVAFSDSKLGLWINAVHTNSSMYEPWTRGSPEFEFYLENTAVTPRANIICADEDLAIEPYKWNMDSDYYFSPFLIAGDDVFPQGTPYIITMWEDDDGRCEIKTSVDHVQETIKLFQSAYEVYKLIKSKDYINDQVVVHIRNAAIAGRALINGNDDYVGTSAGQIDISSKPVQFMRMNDNVKKVHTGWLHLQWKTDIAH